MSDWRIPLCEPDLGAEEEAAVLRVLRRKWLSMGPEVEAFEREFADFLGVKHAIALANATAALHLAYVALEIAPGDEIIQPALNFVAAANMTVAVGAKPVFADIVALEEPTLDPAEVERCITPRTKAIVAMHYAGYPCRMGQLAAICQRYHLALVEDACHAVGARYDAADGEVVSGMLGAIGDIGSFSFFSNKNMAVGEGGMAVTNRDDLAAKVRLSRSHGMTSLTWDRHKGHASSYEVILNGFNYRLDELRAALGRCQLQKLPLNNERRRRLVAHYRQRFNELPNWRVPFVDGRESACHLMVAVAPDAQSRQRALEALGQDRVQTSLHYPCVADFSAMSRWCNQSLDKTRAFQRRAITLPLFPSMKEDDVDRIVSVIARGR